MSHSSRLVPALAACLLSGAFTWSTRALAENTQSVASPEAERSAPIAQSPVLPATVPALPSLADEPVPFDWAQTIETRLSALAPRAPKHVRGSSVQLGARLSPIVDRAVAPIAIHVRDLQTGETLFDDRGTRRLNPASNQKILTGAAAVELLGGDYRFETRLLRDGDSLVLVGEGDPQFRVNDLYALIAEAQAEGALEGVHHLVVDDSAFGPEYEGRGYVASTKGDAYLAPAGALSVDFNTIEVRVRPAAVNGETPTVEVSPPSAAVSFDIRASTGGPTTLHIDTEANEDGGTRVVVRGTLQYGSNGRTLRRRIFGNPALHTGAVAAKILEDLTDQRVDVVTGTATSTAEVVAVHASIPLRDVMASALKYSNNFTSEMVLRTLAWRATGEGTWDAGVAMLDRFRTELGGDPGDWTSLNGSGLSHDGRATPSAIVDILALAIDPTTESGELLGSWAAAGGKGTMEYRLRRTKGRVRAKTGTLFGVSALSGIVWSRDGSRQVGFSILVNAGRALDTRDDQDQLVRQIVAYLDWDRP